MEKHSERFAVSSDGYRQLNEARDPWELGKEVIQNVFDEAGNGATTCTVRVLPVAGAPDRTLLEVLDDGPGFRNIADAYTLMRPTEKRRNPTLRGRFNLGDKEVVSVSKSAAIETVGWTVRFPEGGGREVEPNDRKQGTLFSAVMPWDAAKAEKLVDMVRRFRPTECALVINGEEVPKREPIASRRARMVTVVQDAPGEPMRQTRRVTQIDVLSPHDSEAGWIYEMGIPIQPTDSPYDIDVLQKVPMPPNRNTVAANYLQDIYAEVLNAVHEDIPEDEFGKNWIRSASEDRRVSKEAFQSVTRGRYGTKIVMWSRDRDANFRATEAGYEVINGRSLSPEERKHLREFAGVQSAAAVFQNDVRLNVLPDSELTVHHRRFAQWVVQLAGLAGMLATVSFTHDPQAKLLACCTPDTRTPQVYFNTGKLDESFFRGRSSTQLELIIHELGHAENRLALEHGPKWGNACATVGAKIALALVAESGMDLSGAA